MISQRVDTRVAADAEKLRRRADLYRRLASLARNPDTAGRLTQLAQRFAAQADETRP